MKQSSTHGLGVFAGQTIKPRQMIEECYALVVDEKENDDLANFYFGNDETTILPLGYGAIYNHSCRPNATFEIDIENVLG